ncbi:sulfite exporter TauE/SafE family protein [Pseudarthrobacter sp. Fe7]|nr:sulfite exporter TauE/SafE family protein [Pseudarthrobacter sp. Fe7]
MGFALVAAPFLSMVLGPFGGVLLVNTLGALTSLLILPQVFKEVDLRRVLVMLIPALVAILLGSWVAVQVSAALLSILVGAMILVALTASVAVRTPPVILRGRFGAAAAGFVSGFMNVTAGAGGPAVAAYAQASGWPQRAFAASAQLYFLGIGAASLAAKGQLPGIDCLQWVSCGVALTAGILLGNVLGPKIPHRFSMALVLVLALTGAVLILAKGIAMLA